LTTSTCLELHVLHPLLRSVLSHLWLSRITAMTSNHESTNYFILPSCLLDCKSMLTWRACLRENLVPVNPRQKCHYCSFFSSKTPQPISYLIRTP
jgi:hypothetical protein